jgi:hypothetical protein
MNSIIKDSLTPLAAAVLLACGNAAAQTDPVNQPDPLPPADDTPAPREEPWQPDAEAVPARPEQVEEVIDEVLDPEFDPSEAEDSASAPLDPESVDSDRTNSGPPTDDRLAEERVDPTLEDPLPADDDEVLDGEETAEDR